MQSLHGIKEGLPIIVREALLSQQSCHIIKGSAMRLLLFRWRVLGISCNSCATQQLLACCGSKGVLIGGVPMGSGYNIRCVPSYPELIA